MTVNQKISEDLAKRLSDKRVRLETKPDIRDVKTVSQLCKYLGVGAGEWDGILVTDGSATTYDKTAGWAGVLIEARSLQRRTFYGGFSGGTNNVAELMAVVQTLFALSAEKAAEKIGGYRLHVVADSQYVVDGLNKDDMYLKSGSANRGLWFAVQGCRRDGIVCTGHLIPRDTIPLNQLAHALANIARKAQIDLDTDVFEAFGADSQSAMPD